jgi:hypothetical protein
VLRRPRSGPEPGCGTFADQLCSDDGDFARGVDPQPHLAPLKAHDGHADIVTDE